MTDYKAGSKKLCCNCHSTECLSPIAIDPVACYTRTCSMFYKSRLGLKSCLFMQQSSSLPDMKYYNINHRSRFRFSGPARPQVNWLPRSLLISQVRMTIDNHDMKSWLVRIKLLQTCIGTVRKKIVTIFQPTKTSEPVIIHCNKSPSHLTHSIISRVGSAVTRPGGACADFRQLR